MAKDFICFDFETLGQIPHKCTVVSFGIIAGNWSDVDITDDDSIKNTIKTLKSNGMELFFKYAKEDQPDRVSDPRTAKWWSEQDPKTISYVFGSNPRITLDEFYPKLKEFCSEQYVNKDTTVIIRAPHFDQSILESILDTRGIANMAYSHWKIRDSRTIVDILAESSRGHLVGFESYMQTKFGLKKHSALDDTVIDILEIAFCKAGAKENDFRTT